MKPLRELTREELYELVWSEAMSVLAPRLGISDVGLKKRCASLGIPTPGKGYWARRAAGQRPPREPLPESYIVGSLSKRRRLPGSPDEVRTFSAPRENYASARLATLAARTLRRAANVRPEPDGLCRVEGPGLLAIRASRPQLARAAWLWSRLLEQLPEEGLALSTQGSCAVTDGAESLGLTLVEKSRQYEAPYDERIDGVRLFGSPPATVKRTVPSGFLLFRGEDASGLSWIRGREWRDTPLGPLDDNIPTIAAELREQLLRKAEIGRERAEQAITREEESRRSAEAARLRRIEDERRGRLLAMADAYAGARRIRDLVDALADDEDTREFREWAQQVADETDPRPEIRRRARLGEDPATRRTGWVP